jgi:hypothetical protein
MLGESCEAAGRFLRSKSNPGSEMGVSHANAGMQEEAMIRQILNSNRLVGSADDAITAGNRVAVSETTSRRTLRAERNRYVPAK